jgi:spoIIIJ-associated protein
MEEGTPRTPMADLDPERLKAVAEEVVRQLVRPIADNVEIVVDVTGERVNVSLQGTEDSGLLIGREGQTLEALQYLASRIVCRIMDGAVRLQLDAGDYRRHQDDRLREMALALAKRVLQSGKVFSTRPLSSYHRRIVHLCLQEIPEIQTRSTGEGPLKRVVIMRARPAER